MRLFPWWKGGEVNVKNGFNNSFFAFLHRLFSFEALSYVADNSHGGESLHVSAQDAGIKAEWDSGEVLLAFSWILLGLSIQKLRHCAFVCVCLADLLTNVWRQRPADSAGRYWPSLLRPFLHPSSSSSSYTPTLHSRSGPWHQSATRAETDLPFLHCRLACLPAPAPHQTQIRWSTSIVVPLPPSESPETARHRATHSPFKSVQVRGEYKHKANLPAHKQHQSFSTFLFRYFNSIDRS